MQTVPATPDLVPFLLARLTRAERETLDALTDGKASQAIKRNVASSRMTWCGMDAGGVVNMGGIIPVPGTKTGYVWQIATPALVDNKRAYIVQGRALLVKASGMFDNLTTNICAEYAAALRHMRRFGFTTGAPYNFDGTAVCRCERTCP